MLAYVGSEAFRPHHAVGVPGRALDATHDEAEVVLAVCLAVVDAQNGVEVVGHHYELVKFDFGVFGG